MIEIAIGIAIAFTVGLTGLGGGSFTTPVLVLLMGLPAAAAIATALAFSAVVRVIAARSISSVAMSALAASGRWCSAACPD